MKYGEVRFCVTSSGVINKQAYPPISKICGMVIHGKEYTGSVLSESQLKATDTGDRSLIASTPFSTKSPKWKKRSNRTNVQILIWLLESHLQYSDRFQAGLVPTVERYKKGYRPFG